MKIKSDFITNSSNSSFIVIWPHRIESIDDVTPYIAPKYCETIFNDAKKQKPLEVGSKRVVADVAKEISYGYIYDYGEELVDSYEYEEFYCKENNIDEGDILKVRAWRDQMWKEYEIKKEIAEGRVAEKFLKEVKDGQGYIYTFNYGDEDGSYFSELEHGGTFRNLKHLQISHH